MARSDLIVKLVRAGVARDDERFRRAVEALIVEEEARQHHTVAKQLAEALSTQGPSVAQLTAPKLPSTGLVFERAPRRTLSELVLPKTTRQAVQELVEEQHRGDLLRNHGLEPRHRLVLVGPPGNGKTTLAEAIADALLVPLLMVRYDAIISSFLGETAVRLRQLFDQVRTRPCVLFFDEFDALGKERGDEHETGEIKRVVNTLLMQIDDLPSHVVVVAATNHPELLDRAAWRRFQLRLELPSPTQAQLAHWFQTLSDRLGQPLGLAPRTLAAKLPGISFAEAEEFAQDVRRRQVLGIPDADLKRIVNDRLAIWTARYIQRSKSSTRR
ncbi:MAG: ATP-binding protein [Planctomycetes bacterium]|nr:ATP-binding protein [Planctomycetota bacterium]